MKDHVRTGPCPCGSVHNVAMTPYQPVTRKPIYLTDDERALIVRALLRYGEAYTLSSATSPATILAHCIEDAG